MMFFFSNFSRKYDLTLHANCLLRRQFAWSVKSYFLGKVRKIFQNFVCWNFHPGCKVLKSQRSQFTSKISELCHSCLNNVTGSDRMISNLSPIIMCQCQNITVFNINIVINRPEQTVKTKIKCHRRLCLIWFYTICHSSSIFIHIRT